MCPKLPKKVYRYQCFSKWTLQALVHDKLYFSDPSSFNDPFDCKPTVRSDADRDILRKILKNLIIRRVESETTASLSKAKLNGEKSNQYAERIGKQAAQNEILNLEYHATNPDYEGSTYENECWLLTNEIERELLKRYDRGICCFSTSFKNPLLWSHYGEQHNGICIGYNIERKPVPVLQKVQYGGNRIINTSLIEKAILRNDKVSQEILDQNILLRKAPPWKYEGEWRLFGNRGVHDSPLALKDITFGLRCPIEIIHSVVSALENRTLKIDFFKTYEVPGEFELKRREVDIDEMKAFFPRTAMSGEEIFGPVIDSELIKPNKKKA